MNEIYQIPLFENITAAELTQLAALYSVGETLWRVPIAHFSPWDHNWPFGPPEAWIRSALDVLPIELLARSGPRAGPGPAPRP